MLTLMKQVRFSKYKTQISLMVATGIPQSRLSTIENGYYPPKAEEARKIAKALGVRIKDLFPNGNGGPKK